MLSRSLLICTASKATLTTTIPLIIPRTKVRSMFLCQCPSPVCSLNSGYRYWDKISFNVDVSSFKDSLRTYTEDHPQPGFPRRKVPNKKADSGVVRLRRTARTRQLTEKAQNMDYPQRARCTRQGKVGDAVSPQSPLEVELDVSMDECSGMAVKDAGTTDKLRWKTLQFLLHMKIENGLLGHYTLECPMAPLETRKTEGTVSLTWMHRTGTC